ncbi:hypothetical protein BB561_002459 [Smittium simulii]|uniref:Cytochrome c oxidase subunit n=1 Tax=Smittium simulii TaxID=133385 RepID=A0A2T9YQM2_9FUNG|nr:hypothetical protein BB561_002459 [Smittium simulii]
MTEFKLETPGYDGRFPQINSTKRCWQNYVDYHRCINLKGEDYAPCKQFYRTFRSLCPDEWTERWDEQRDEGKFPVDLSSN